MQAYVRPPVRPSLILNLSNTDNTMTTYLADLTMHHTIEERHIFPLLAKKMPEFRANEAHIKSHQGIHIGGVHGHPNSQVCTC